MKRRNVNRGYMKLTVWQDAIACYVQTVSVFHKWPYEMKRIASQQTASVDSIHRNIAEGYCRKSLKEYLHFLNVALSSIGESVSVLCAYHEARQLTDDECETRDAQACKMESELKRLIESLQEKRRNGTWQDELRGHGNGVPPPENLWTPGVPSSIIPLFHHSIFPSFRYF